MTVQNSEQYKPANSDTQSSFPAQFFSLSLLCLFSFPPRPLSFLVFPPGSECVCYSRPSFILFAESAESFGSLLLQKLAQERADL